jgi:hypothetical protein
MCLRAYDEAKRRLDAPTAFEHVLSDTALTRTTPTTEHEKNRIDSWSEPVPEAATAELLRARGAWEEVLRDAGIALEVSSLEYDKKGLDPQAPCPNDLALDYKRVFRAKEIVQGLSTLIDQALAGHMLRPNEMPPWIVDFYGKAPAKDVARRLKRKKKTIARRT